MPTHIYQRPVGDQGDLTTPIKLVGNLPDYELGVAYEGRLQILNSRGPHFVRQVGGDRLPAGTSIYVDEATKEVVVSWPALYKIEGSVNQYDAPLRNADFEGTKGWEFGTGWFLTTDAFGGSHSMAYRKQNGSSFSSHTSRYPVIPDRLVTAICDVNQGASARYNAGARVTLEWRDAKGDLMSRSLGNMVDDASKGRVYPSKVQATAPQDAVTVNIGFEGMRIRENKDVWVDNFKWDFVTIDVILPVNPDESYDLELEVTDSVGRTAKWSGAILQSAVYVTGQLMPFVEYIDMGLSAAPYLMKFEEQFPTVEPINLSAVCIGMEYRSFTKIFQTFDEDKFSVSAVALSMNYKDTAIKRTVDPEFMSVSAVPLGIMLKTHPRIAAPDEAVTLTAIPLGISYG